MNQEVTLLLVQHQQNDAVMVMSMVGKNVMIHEKQVFVLHDKHVTICVFVS